MSQRGEWDYNGRVSRQAWMLATTALITTKLYAPPPPEAAVARPRLTQRLGTSTAVTLIAAPPGFGKTTLVSEWVQREHGRAGSESDAVAWVSLDRADNDLARFLQYIIAAMQPWRSGLGEAALRLLGQPAVPSVEEVLPALINDLAALPPPAQGTRWLVLDDYHEITAQPVHDAVSGLIDRRPPHLRVLITSRADPPLPLARWRARGLLTEVRSGDLRFTSDEAGHFLNETRGLRLDPAAVAALEARTEGWVAGLQLAALSMRNRDDADAFVAAFAGSHRYLVDYLVEEVLLRQPPGVRDFLLRTAVLERLSAPLCEALLGADGPPAQAMLELLERQNLFLLPLDDAREWYRYHQLFAEVLRHRLAQTLPAAEIAGLHCRAAEWLAGHGDTSEAIAQALAGGASDLAADLVAGATDGWMRRGEIMTLRDWLERLPEPVVRARPSLSLARAEALVSAHRLEEAETLLREARQAARGWADEDRLDLWAARVRVRLASRRNDFPLVMSLAKQVLSRLPPDEVYARGQMQQHLGVALFWLESLVESLPYFAEAGRLALVAGDLNGGLRAYSNQADIHYTLGRLNAAAALAREGLEVAERHHATQTAMTGTLHASLASVLYQRNELDAAAQHLDTAFGLGERGVDPFVRMLNRVALARLRQAQGDLAAALQVVAEARSLADEHQLSLATQSQVHACQVWLWLAHGDLDQAAAWARTIQSLLPPIEDSLSESLHLALARVELALGQIGPALARLAALITRAEAGGRTTDLIELLVCLGLAQTKAGALDQALRTIGRALALGEPEAFCRVFVDEGDGALPLLQLWLADAPAQAADGSEAERLRAYARRLLLALGPRPAAAGQSAAPPAATGPDALSSRELEVLRLIDQGLSNAEIAARLVVAPSTVKKHINRIFGKLGAAHRAQALARARRLNLL